MQSTARAFPANAHEALGDRQLQSALARFGQGFPVKRQQAIDRLPEFDALRDAAKAIKKFAKDNKAVMADFRFVDWPGMWQHCTFPISEITEDVFENGLGFDGSSIRGWKSIHESDMLMVPDPSTAFMDPFFEHPTLVLICDVQDPITREPYDRDPRYIAKKAEAHLKASGVGDTAFIGPELEFFLFNSARFSSGSNEGYYHLDSIEGVWNSGAVEGGANLAYKTRSKEGYFPVPPTDKMQDVRTEMVLTLQQLGIAVEAHHHEVATAGQAEIDMLIVALPMAAEQRLVELLKKLWVLPVDIRLSAHTNKLRFRPRTYSFVGKVPFLDVFDKPIAEPGDTVYASVAALNAKPALKTETSLTVVDEALFVIESEKKDFLAFFGGERTQFPSRDMTRRDRQCVGVRFS